MLSLKQADQTFQLLLKVTVDGGRQTTVQATSTLPLPTGTNLAVTQPSAGNLAITVQKAIASSVAALTRIDTAQLPVGTLLQGKVLTSQTLPQVPGQPTVYRSLVRLLNTAQSGATLDIDSPTPLRILGEHPTEGGNIGLFKGRYGPYVEHRGLFASLPRGGDPETLTLEDALAMLAAQIAMGKKPKPQRGAKAAPAAKKKATTKAATTKPTATKSAAKPKAAAKAKPKAPAKTVAVAAPPPEPAPKLRRKTAG